MKIKRLSIRNITSLENVDIDFSLPPLSQTGIFLIAGEIGTGKSTILDAICLALFRTTPRLAAWKSSGKDVAEGDDITEKSPQQLLRRGASRGAVSLTFEDEAGVEYIAEWSVARARMKPTGKIQSPKWSLSYFKNGEQIILEKVNDIKAVIKEVTGLEFDQFCRTSLLAQGEFTRFLNSSDKEKSEILEKITGTEIYAEIGRKLYATIKDKEASLSQIKNKIGDISLLSDEELKSVNEEYNCISLNISDNNSLLKKIESKLKWLETFKVLNSQRENALKNLEALRCIEQSKEYDDKKRELDFLNVTRDIRLPAIEMQHLNDEIHNCKCNITNADSQLVALAPYVANFLQNNVQNRLEKESVDLYINENRDKSTLFDRIDELKLIHGNIEKNTLNVASFKSQSDSLSESENKITKNSLLPAEELLIQQKSKLIKSEEECAGIQKQILDLESGSPRELLSSIISRLNLVDSAIASFQKLTDEIKRRDSISDDIEKYSIIISGNKSLKLDAEQKLSLKQSQLDIYQNSYNQANNISELIQKISSHIHQGDSCPICKNIISSPLPSENELNEDIARISLSIQSVKKSIQDLSLEINNLSITISTNESLLKSANGVIQDSSVLNQLSSEYNSILQQLEASDINEVKDMKISLTEELSKIQTTIHRLDILYDQFNQSTSTRNNITAEILKSEKNIETISSQLKDLNEEHTRIKTLCDAAEKAIIDGMSQISSVLISFNINVEQSDFRSTLDSLHNEKLKYNEFKKKSETLSSIIETNSDIEKSIINLASDIDKEGLLIDTDFKTVKRNQDSTDFSPLQLLNLWTRYASDIKMNTLAIKEKSQKAESLSTSILKQLEALDISPDKFFASIANADQRLRDLSNYISAHSVKKGGIEASLASAENELQTHSTNRPDLLDKDTPENLKAEIDRIKTQNNEHHIRIGQITTILQNDKDARESVKSLTGKLGQAQKELDEWNKLSMLSDATGSTFKKIAQSYILGALVKSANEYLDRLSGRYLLSHFPGTFTLFIKDSWEGWSERPVSTISGGESFLVSLSLALALTDFCNTLQVDTLFIDEGFGTLSGDALNRAVTVLKDLHSITGRKVGIISHIKELRNHIPVTLQLHRSGTATSSTLSIL